MTAGDGWSPGAPNRLGVGSRKPVLFTGISQANQGHKQGRGLGCHRQHGDTCLPDPFLALL